MALVLAELSVGRGDGRALGPADANGRRAGPPHPAEGCPVTAAAHRGATAPAASLADQGGGLAGGRGGAGWAGAGGVCSWAARSRRGGHGRRRRRRAEAWRAACARSGGALAGLGVRRFMVDSDHAGGRAVAGIADLAALASSAGVAGGLAAGERLGVRPGGNDRAAAAAVRGGPANQLG